MDRIMTKTLAEIYIQQGHFEEAYKIFKVLSEKDPSNMEIQKRLKELSEKLKRPSPLTDQSIRTTEEKIRLLEKWLANIRKRKRG
jgi:tetratricopeptide (TPR) repeat protein